MFWKYIFVGLSAVGFIKEANAANGEYSNFRIIDYAGAPMCRSHLGVDFAYYTGLGDRVECFALCVQYRNCIALAAASDVNEQSQCRLYFNDGTLPTTMPQLYGGAPTLYRAGYSNSFYEYNYDGYTEDEAGDYSHRTAYGCFKRTGTLAPTQAPTQKPTGTQAPTQTPTDTQVPTVSPTNVQSTCSARIITAYDATYTRKTNSGIKEAKQIISKFVNALPLDSGVSMGFLVLDRHATLEIVDVDSANANDPTVLLNVISNLYKRNSNTTNMKELFTTYADKVSDVSIPSYIVLFTDGKAEGAAGKNFAFVETMKNRLGSAAPRVLCYQTLNWRKTEFLMKLCDKVIFQGKRDVSYDTLAARIVDEICP